MLGSGAAPPEWHGFSVDSLLPLPHPVRCLSFAGVPQISLMMHFFTPSQPYGFLSFLSAISFLQIELSLQLHCLTCSTSILSLHPVPMVKGPQGTITPLAHRWAHSSVCLENGFHKVLKCDIYSQKWWLSCSKRMVCKEGTYSKRLPTFLRTWPPPEESAW